MYRKSWKNTILITISRIRRWKRQWSSDSIARSKTTCGRCLHSTAITSESTSYRVSCQIITRASIAPSACEPLRRNFCDRRKTLRHSVHALKIAGPAKFKVSDSVRVSKYKTIFEDYTPNWTTEEFTIVKMQRTNPVTYLFEDYRGKSVAGAFYEHELHRATHPDVYLVEKVLRRKGDKVYVKWLGFDGSHNSWIHKNNVIW